MSLLPDFLVIGTMKGGTTSLFHYLRSHPGVFLPDRKEVDFFVDDELRGGTWSRGLEWYTSLFVGSEDAEARGEVSPNYTKFPFFHGVPQRIRDVLGPDVRLVYVVRHPLERLKSHWAHAQSVWGATESLEDAAVGGHLRTCSNYALQVEQYLDVFPVEQLLVVTSERLASEPAGVVGDVLAFLGVADPSLAADVGGRHHESDKKPFPRFGGRAAGLYRWTIQRPTITRRAARKVTVRRLTAADLQLRPDVAERVRDELRREVDALRALVPVDVSHWDL